MVPWQGFLLTIIGEGSQREKIRQFIKRNSLVQFIKVKGRITYEQIFEEYENADIFVLPSKPTKTWQEQYGMVLVEAMAAGLPIVASRTGAIPEVLGGAGLLVEPGNLIQLTKALASLVKNPTKRVELGLKVRKRAEEFFDRKEVAKKIRRIYSFHLRGGDFQGQTKL